MTGRLLGEQTRMDLGHRLAPGPPGPYLARSMKYQNVRIASLSYALPDQAVTSEELEQRIAPLYDRLGLHAGRLELMSGIQSRRFWPKGTRPSDAATLAGRKALEASGVDKQDIGVLIHSSVCRDFMEPATASVVHAALEIPRDSLAFDLSNACLGFANALGVAANMIESGEMKAALIVSGEDGGPLVEETLAWLNRGDEVTRKDLKAAFSSLTIGSGAVAAVLQHCPDPEQPGPRLLGTTARSATEFNHLCSGDRSEGQSGPLMETDSEALLQAGIDLAEETFAAFTKEHAVNPGSIDRVITHQVGSAHRKLLYQRLGLDLKKDFSTFPSLGNIGSVSMPITLAMAAEENFIRSGHQVALLGIGSGLACQMLHLNW